MKRFFAIMLALCLMLSIGQSAMAVAPRAYVKASSLTLNKAQEIVVSGSTLALRETILPEHAEANSNDALLSWTSANTSIATVSKYGVVTPVGLGNTIITLSLLDGSGLTATCHVTVTSQPITAITLNATGKTMNPGSLLRLKPTVTPATALDQAVTWRSSDAGIATVDADGLVQAIKPGRATIYCKAKVGTAEAYCTIRVAYEQRSSVVRFYGIVNSQYPASLAKVPYYLEDAEALYELYDEMVQEGTAETAELNRQQTGAQMRTILARIAANKSITKDDVTVFYYAGLGAISDVASEKGALVGVDGDYGAGLVTIAELQSYLDKIPGTIVLVLDCNQAGQFIKSKGFVVTNPEKEARAFNASVIAQFQRSTAQNFSLNAKEITGAARTKYKILTACGASHKSNGTWDAKKGTGHAFFSKHLVRCLEGKGDHNKDGVITMREAAAYTKTKVAAEITKANKGKSSKNKLTQTVNIWPANDFSPMYVLDAADGGGDDDEWEEAEPDDGV